MDFGDEFCYRFYRCIESHVFFDNYYSPEKITATIPGIRAHINRLIQIKRANTILYLSESEATRYIGKNKKRNFSLLSQDIKYSEAFIKYIESHKKNGAPKMLFKPAMLTLGAIELVKEGRFSEDDFRKFFSAGGILYTSVEFLFEKKLDIKVSFPLLNDHDPISDLTERLVRGLKLKGLSEQKRKSFIQEAKTLVSTSPQKFGEMVTVGNRYVHALNANIYMNLLKRKDERLLQEYVYIDDFDPKIEGIFLQIQRELNTIKRG